MSQQQEEQQKIIFNSDEFKDEFGKYSKNYATTRPLYPNSLYELIDKTVDSDKRDLAVDVGCGNGQNAVNLTKLFKKVIAFDPSEGQIKNALKNEKVEYHVGSAENINVPDNSADLITVATAVHWFNLPIFFKETERILKKGGYLILFTYGFHEISNNEEANKVNREMSSTIIRPEYWNATVRRLVDGGYKEIVPPYKNTQRTEIKFKTNVSIGSLLGHYSSWSAFSNFVKKNPDPLPQVRQRLFKAFNTTDEDTIMVECEYTVHIIISKKE